MRSRLVRIGSLAALLLAAACSGDLVAGGMKDVEMYAVADGSSQGAGAASAAGTGYERSAAIPVSGSEASAPTVTTVAVAGPTGTIEFDVTATLIDDRGAAVPVATDARVPLRLESRDSARFALRRVQQAEYPTLRLTFTRVAATVETGLIVGGVPRPGPLRVEMPAGGLIVDVPVALNIPARPREIIIVDLNASAWMPTLNVLTGSVSASAFRSAVRVRVR
jgi:hypothetical protein